MDISAEALTSENKAQCFFSRAKMSKRMEFRWPHEAAESVRLAGSFNSWQPQDMLFDSVEGLWKVEQEVSPGRHQFKFVVDGLWVHDEDQVMGRLINNLKQV